MYARGRHRLRAALTGHAASTSIWRGWRTRAGSGWPHLQPLAELRPELPPELGATVFRALSYLRDDRFPSCEAFEEELAAIAQRHGLFAGEKAVAEWVNRELALIKSAEPPSASQKAG